MTVTNKDIFDILGLLENHPLNYLQSKEGAFPNEYRTKRDRLYRFIGKVCARETKDMAIAIDAAKLTAYITRMEVQKGKEDRCRELPWGKTDGKSPRLWVFYQAKSIVLELESNESPTLRRLIQMSDNVVDWEKFMDSHPVKTPEFTKIRESCRIQDNREPESKFIAPDCTSSCDLMFFLSENIKVPEQLGTLVEIARTNLYEINDLCRGLHKK